MPTVISLGLPLFRTRIDSAGRVIPPAIALAVVVPATIFMYAAFWLPAL